MHSLGKRYFSVRSTVLCKCVYVCACVCVCVCVCVVDQIYNMVSKRFGVILILLFKQVEDP